MNASIKARHLAHPLRRLDPRRLTADELAGIAGGGGETASTSTSGTPLAGDDTIGDSGSTVRGSGFYQIRDEGG